MWTSSSLMIKQVKVMEPPQVAKGEEESTKWIRYLTTSDSYIFRIN